MTISSASIIIPPTTAPAIIGTGKEEALLAATVLKIQN